MNVSKKRIMDKAIDLHQAVTSLNPELAAIITEVDIVELAALYDQWERETIERHEQKRLKSLKS